jgi:hypothetical protein
MLQQSDTLSWFQANQYLLFVPNDVYLLEKQQVPIFSTGARTHDLPHSRRAR